MVGQTQIQPELETEVVESPEVSPDASDSDVGVEQSHTVEASGLEGVVERTENEFEVTNFKCTKCGLAHGHGPDKHRASDASSTLSSEAAGQMVANPVCHCATHELAMNAEQYGVSQSMWQGRMNGAPIDDSVHRELANLN